MDRRFESTERRLGALDQKVSRHFVWLVRIQVSLPLAMIAALSGRWGEAPPATRPSPQALIRSSSSGTPARRSKRVREIGIRTALGATSGAVVGQVVRHAETLTLMGAAIGLLGAYASSRLIASMLFGVSALDPLTYGAVTALMAGVALLAAWAPARRAVGVDPTIALRTE